MFLLKFPLHVENFHRDLTIWSSQFIYLDAVVVVLLHFVRRIHLKILMLEMEFF